MYTFIGRDKELCTLQTAYESDRSELVVVYGRRRIGKTALLTQFCKDKAGVYFAAKRQDDAGQRQDFNETMKRLVRRFPECSRRCPIGRPVSVSWRRYQEAARR